jgi:hypothetical protein
MQLYTPFKSKLKNKKYSVYVLSKAGNQKNIHFGSASHEHYHDKLGNVSHLNHNDKKYRALYYKRHKRHATRTPRSIGQIIYCGNIAIQVVPTDMLSGYIGLAHVSSFFFV